MDLRARLGDVRILGIGGSLRKTSCSYRALEYAISLVREVGCKAEVFDLRAMPLPFCNGDKEEEWPEYPGVAHLRRLTRDAHALILATPEYHGGVSGVLKNALDLLDFEHLAGKVTGTISVLGGPPNSNALNDLRRILRWCHAWVIPEQIAIARAGAVFAEGHIQDQDLVKRFHAFARSLVRTTLRLNDRFLSPDWLPEEVA